MYDGPSLPSIKKLFDLVARLKFLLCDYIHRIAGGPRRLKRQNVAVPIGKGRVRDSLSESPAPSPSPSPSGSGSGGGVGH